jgi:cephalosporin hydroxylase
MMQMIKALNDRSRFLIRRFKAFRRLRQFHTRPRTIEEAVDKALKFGGRKEFDVNTIQIREEILALARTVAALQPKVILEIGTAFGGTLFIWSQLASDLVISCDIMDKAVQRDFYRKFPPPGSRCAVELMTGDSHTPEFRKRVAGLLGGRKVDFLFIDGDHTEAGVTADYQDYRDLVRPGGVIAFHDIVEKQIPKDNQVYHLWKRIRHEPGAEEYIKDRDQTGYGIGIIRVPET